jgi:hypothetical protein
MVPAFFRVYDGRDPPNTVRNMTTLDELRQRATQYNTVLDGVASDLSTQMPEPQEHVIRQSNPADSVPDDSNSQQFDALGIPWNPEVHATGEDGAGIKKRDGSWKKKRRSRLGGNSSSSSEDKSASSENSGDPGAPRPEIVDRESSYKSGEMMAGMLIGICCAVGGEEFKPRKDPYDEQKMQAEAWGAYFYAKGITDLPVGWALVFATSMYVLPRFAMPVTQSRSKKLWAWIKRKTTSLWLWREERKGRKVTQREREEASDGEVKLTPG